MFGGKGKIKIDPDLYEKAASLAESRGYASVEELIAHLIETEIAREGGSGDDVDEKEVRDKLSGLGYIS